MWIACSMPTSIGSATFTPLLLWDHGIHPCLGPLLRTYLSPWAGSIPLFLSLRRWVLCIHLTSFLNQGSTWMSGIWSSYRIHPSQIYHLFIDKIRIFGFLLCKYWCCIFDQKCGFCLFFVCLFVCLLGNLFSIPEKSNRFLRWLQSSSSQMGSGPNTCGQQPNISPDPPSWHLTLMGVHSNNYQ